MVSMLAISASSSLGDLPMSSYRKCQWKTRGNVTMAPYLEETPIRLKLLANRSVGFDELVVFDLLDFSVPSATDMNARPVHKDVSPD